MKYQTYLLFGAPGSGKGTQGRTLGSIPRFFHCACGDVFRSIDTRTKVGRAFLEYSSKGQLVPDEITVELWKAQIDAAVNSHTFKPDIDILVLDGIPRNVGQAKIMDDLIDVKKVFHLSCPNRDALFARLKKRALKDNRLDDANEEVIQAPSGSLRDGIQTGPRLLRPGADHLHRRDRAAGEGFAAHPRKRERRGERVA